MRTRHILGPIFIFLCCLFFSNYSTAQQVNRDSLIAAQNAKKDSIAAAQQRRADSIAAVKSYLKSKQYNDSIDAIRKARMDSIRTAKQRIADSIELVKQRRNDSIATARQRFNDSLQDAIATRKAEQQRMIDSINDERQRRADSIAEVKAYRNSKHFKDSVARERQQYIDSIKQVRQQQQDSIKQVRQQLQDSMNQVRQQRTDSIKAHIDSMKAVRELRLDSLKQAQQARKDSLEKVKDLREQERDKREAEQKAKKRKVTEDKIKKKQDEYTNEKMLKKKWSFLRRAMQNTTTRYNYYFNAKTKMKEAEDNMFRSRQDNYDSLIALYPFDPDRDSTKLATDMDSLIKRISVGIQIHDPRAKWQDDLFLLLGKAYYYRGDYKNAAAAFQYIVANAEKMEKEAAKNKKSTGKKNTKTAVKTDYVSEEKSGLAGMLAHQSAKNDALLWMSRVYTQTKEYTKAQILLDMVTASPKLPARLKGDLAFNKAFYYLAQGQNIDALPYLDSVATNKSVDNNIRERAGYIAGQLYQQQNKWDNAAKMYEQVIALHPPVEMDFKAQIGKILAQEYSNTTDKNAVLKQLLKLSKEAKYNQYFDQIHYSIANMYVDMDDKKTAINHYRQSIDNAKNNALQKGMSYYKMANVFYYDNNYLSSKKAYDSALTLLNSSHQPMYDIAMNRSMSLAQIADPGMKVNQIDSLLALSQMSEREQRAHVRQHIKALEQAKAAAAATPAIPSTSGPSNPNDWYFNNASLVARGETDFKQKWGNRPLKDNWRRSSVMNAEFTNGEEDPSTQNNELSEDALLALIPKNPATIDSLKNVLEAQMFILGKAFFAAEDYNNAIKTYDNLLEKYPAFSNKADILYDKYIVALKSNDEALANSLKQSLIQNYPNHEKTALIQKTTATADNSDKMAIMQHYDDTYLMLTKSQFKEVLVKVEEAKSLYPVAISTYQNKYNLMRAIAFAGLENYEKADTLLTEFIAINQNDSLKGWATNVHEYVKEQLKNKVSTAPSTPITNNTNAVANAAEEPYDVKKNTTHYVILYTPEFDGKFMGLRAGITDYNSLKKSELNLNSSVAVLEGTKSIIQIKEFSNANLATRYLNELKGQSTLFKDYKVGTNLQYTIISADNLTRLLAKKNFNEYLRFFAQNY